jgi:hypothetical protein
VTWYAEFNLANYMLSKLHLQWSPDYLDSKISERPKSDQIKDDFQNRRPIGHPGVY